MCLFEIALAVYGLISLIRGRMVLTSSKVVEGPAAYFLGIMAMCPMVIVFIGGFAYGVMLGAQGKQDEIEKNQVIITVIELLVTTGFSVLVFGIVGIIGTKPKKKKRKKYLDEDEEEDWEDSTTSRRHRHEDEDDEHEDDDRDVRGERRRDDSDLADDEDRPRRRHREDDDYEQDERPRRKHEDEDQWDKDERPGKHRRSWER